MIDIISYKRKFRLALKIFSQSATMWKENQQNTIHIVNKWRDIYRDLYTKGSTAGIIFCHKSMQLPTCQIPCPNPNLLLQVYLQKGFIHLCQRNKETATISFDKCCMVSIFSLFTVIPPKETIHISTSNLFQTDITSESFSKGNWEKMLEHSPKLHL